MLKSIFAAACVLFGLSSLAQAREAVVSCNVNYVSADGSTTVTTVNQRFYIPLYPGYMYYMSLPVGDRRLDVAAQGVGEDGYSLNIRLWRMTSPGVLCDQTVNGSRAATCQYDSRRTQERADIQCTRLQ
jgi:hypothetical protein